MQLSIKNIWHDLTDPRVEEEPQGRQEYLTRVIFIMVSAGLLVMTVIVLVINYGLGEPEPETTIMMTGMDLLVAIGWGLIRAGRWRLSGFLLPLVFLVFAGYVVFSVGLITTAVVQMAIAVLLAGMLSGDPARWLILILCLATYLAAGWASGERDFELYLTSGIMLFMSLSGIALLEWFFTNLLKKSLQTIYEREAKLKSIFRAAPIGIGVVINRVIQEVNHTLSQMTGYTREELIGKDARILYLSQEDYEYVGSEKYHQIREQDVGSVETRWRRKDGAVRDILLSSVPIDASDLSRGVTFSALDITERKQWENKQKALLKEKDILLAEVHHRVKNNMQVVISLLGLQAKEIDNERFRAVYDESRRRIGAMALVHEQLYRAGEYAHIDFALYTDQLASRLFNMYEVDRNRVQFQVDAENIFLELDQAIPCGLLLNELITNSLKYAFSEGRKGKLWVHLKPQKGKMILSVGDDGVGIPENVDFDVSQSLGLQLIKLLSEHDLHGNVKVLRKKGTQFRIEFPVISELEE